MSEYVESVRKQFFKKFDIHCSPSENISPDKLIRIIALLRDRKTLEEIEIEILEHCMERDEKLKQRLSELECEGYDEDDEDEERSFYSMRDRLDDDIEVLHGNLYSIFKEG